MTQCVLARESMWLHFHASETCKEFSDSDIMLKLTVHCETSGRRGPAPHLLSVSLFLRAAGGKRSRPLLCCVLSVLGVCCSVWLFQVSWKELLGNRNGHRPGSLSGKWNPESGSQTSNHTFVLFIHFRCGALARAAWGRRAEMNTSVHAGKSSYLRRIELTFRNFVWDFCFCVSGSRNSVVYLLINSRADVCRCRFGNFWIEEADRVTVYREGWLCLLKWIKTCSPHIWSPGSWQE